MPIQYPSIELISEEIHRPLWSIMIPTYNGTKYLEQTIKSVLTQALEPNQMQIEVIDDCSTEGKLEALVRDVGEGRVSFYRNPQNVGLVRNWNVCIQRAHGQWVHILHQDDIVLPGFYEKLKKAVMADSTVGAAFCRHTRMDEDGHWQELSIIERREAGVLEQWIEKIAVWQRIEFPSMIVKRSVYEKLGGFYPEIHYAADWEMWKRIAAHYSVWFEPNVLACYRQHSASETSRLAKVGLDIVDTRKAIQISELYLPCESVSKLSRKSREFYALYALGKARKLLIKHEFKFAVIQIREALNCSFSFRVIYSILRLFVTFSKQLFAKNS